MFDLDTDVDRQGATLAHTLSTTGNPPAPVVPAMAERRKNGDILLVSRDVTNIFRIRKAIINAFAMGGAFCQATGIAVGLAIGVRQMRSVRGIRHAAHRARSSHPACTCRFFSLQHVAASRTRQRLAISGVGSARTIGHRPLTVTIPSNSVHLGGWHAEKTQRLCRRVTGNTRAGSRRVVRTAGRNPVN